MTAAWNGMFFTHSPKILMVGRWMSGKTWQSASAWRATGVVDGQVSGILRPCLIIDVDGGSMSYPAEMRQAPDTKYLGITTERDWHDAMREAASGRYRLIIFDSWSNLFDKFAGWARVRDPSAKGRNRDWNSEARDQVASALEEWSDLAVRPSTRGVVLVSTAAVQDHWVGEWPNRIYAGEKIKVAPTIEDRLIGRHTTIWHCTREDPPAVIDPRNGLTDVAATNAAIREGTLRPRFLLYTYPLNGMPYIKKQDGFAPWIDPIATDLTLGEVLTRHHDAEGVKTVNPQTETASQ